MLYTAAVDKMDKITPLRELRERIIGHTHKKITNKVIADGEKC